MFHVLGNTILPIFSIILLGYVLKLKQIIDPAYARTANLIVYYVAIPAMLFNSTAQASLRANFNGKGVLCLLSAVSIVVLIGLGAAHVLQIPRSRRGTFLQSTFHGNIGYLSYAITYYALGEDHFAPMAILSSFLIVGQNFLSTWVLTAFSSNPKFKTERWVVLRHVAHNPIILAMVFGITYSAMALPLPVPVQKGLDILAGMAFPTALLLIGASLSFGAFRVMRKEIVGIGVLKMVCLPLCGIVLMRLVGVPDGILLLGTILLASPPATISYVMAMEMGGDPELAATSVSIFTLLSALTYSLYLSSLAA